MNEINRFKEHAGAKTMIYGLQGCGKTEHAKQIVKDNNWRCLIYSPNVYDWKSENPEQFILIAGVSKRNFEKFFKLAKKMKEENLIDCILIDEFETVITNKYDMGEICMDYCANHRHWGENVDPEKHVPNGLALVGISRRPQDIPTIFVESAKHTYIYAISGENVQKKMNAIEKQLGNKISKLEYKSYQYYKKEIGKDAVLCKKLDI